MNKKLFTSILAIVLVTGAYFYINMRNEKLKKFSLKIEKKEKSQQEKYQATIDRYLHEFNMQKDPTTGIIPRQEKRKELENALIEKQNNYNNKSITNSYASRGPSNLGGRTRSVIIDVSDPSGNTIIAGGVSSGVFRTTNGGASWTKVSSNSEIHNVTSIAQDPRPGFQNIWYYGTGEIRGNSAGIQENYLGQGVWKSTDGGITWQQIPETANGLFQVYDNFFDFVVDMEVHPITGELFVSTYGKIYRLSSSGPIVELELSNDGQGWTDIEITSTGRVYAALNNASDPFNSGVWTSVDGTGSWTAIAQTSSPNGWRASRRITLALASSNENILYALYDNGQSNSAGNRVSEADLWQYDASTSTWIDFSNKLPDEPGGDSNGNDPFSIQGSYDLVISVKPSDENFVVIGGTNIYKINNINVDNFFSRIGGYKGPSTYALYNEGGVDHHPDIHAIAWDLNDSNTLYSGTDGGIHKTTNLNTNFIRWENLNNNYLTYQYYHVNMLNKSGSDYVIGGAQDNGTTTGGIDASRTDKFQMEVIAGGDGAAVAVTETTGILENEIVEFLTTQRGPLYRLTNATGFSRIQPIENIDSNNNPEYFPSKFVTYFYMDPDNNNALYYASNSNILTTNDALQVDGNSWRNLGGLPLSEDITVFATSWGVYNPNSSYLLIGGENGNIYRLDDPQNATNLSNLIKITSSGVFTGSANSSGQYCSGIAIHPTNPDIVMVVYASYGSTIRNIFITDNATSNNPTWTEVERNLDAFSVRAAAIAEVNGQTQYYVGTARGLYKSLDPNLNDWILEGSNEIGIPVISGLVYRPSDNKLLIGTHGNGMYETTINSTLSLDDNSDIFKLAMYPNPTQFFLKFASNNYDLNNNTKFDIYNVSGTKVLSGKLMDNSINVKNLSQGIYMVNLKNDQNQTISKKFVKN